MSTVTKRSPPFDGCGWYRPTVVEVALDQVRCGIVREPPGLATNAVQALKRVRKHLG